MLTDFKDNSPCLFFSINDKKTPTLKQQTTSAVDYEGFHVAREDLETKKSVNIHFSTD